MKLLSTRKTILVVLSVVLLTFALSAFADSRLRNSKEDVYHDLEVFAKIIEKISTYYVDEVETHELMREAIEGVLRELDPHSQYLDGLEYEDLVVSTRGEFGGLGIFISFRDNFPTVISPIDDTPADRAGIRGGDQIIEIEGMATEGWRVDKAVGYLRGEPGSKVSFKVSRPGADGAIDYVITREVINVKSVPYYGMFENDTGYIKVSNFAKNTVDELEDALEDLEGQGMKGLVLDFRSNPGGLLQAATELSELFLDKDKLLVYTKGRLDTSNRKYYSSNRKTHGGYPVVVMINGASASASEIFAGALQDWDAGFVVGQTSFGKGTVQTVFSLSETEAIKLTTAKYYTPSGRSIHKDHPRRSETNTLATSDGGQDIETPGSDDRSSTGDGEEGDDPDAVTADQKDDVEKPIYYTSSGRIVYGGGGITPDLEFEPRTYTDFQRRLERDALAFSYAVDYFSDHNREQELNVTDAVLEDFYKFLDAREFEYTPEDLTAENVEYIRVMLGREIASHQSGRQAAYRVVTENDPEFKEVVRIMKKAGSLAGMFEYAEEMNAIKKASAE